MVVESWFSNAAIRKHVSEAHLATTTDLERENSRHSNLSTITIENTWIEKKPVLRYCVYNTMLSKPQWCNCGPRTLQIKYTCLRRISQTSRFWKGIIAATQVSTIAIENTCIEKTPALRYFVYNAMLSKQRWWNAGSPDASNRKHVSEAHLATTTVMERYTSRNPNLSTITIENTCIEKTPVLRYFVYNILLSKQWWKNPGSQTLLYESTCLKHISLQPQFWKGRIAAIQF
ncbi:hypothetical protein ANTQUA_LOCUS10085 [Anthophora quadrimaculata]